MVAVVALLASVAAARASVLGATFYPDHGAPGARITVGQLPWPDVCPSVRVYLSREVNPTPLITSAADHRLIQLAGTVRYRHGYRSGTFSGPLPPLTTTFDFRVPRLPPGVYGTYAQCVGGPVDWSGFGPGATTFTVDPEPLPPTDTVTATSTAAPGPADDPRPAALLALALGLATLMGVRRWAGRHEG